MTRLSDPQKLRAALGELSKRWSALTGELLAYLKRHDPAFQNEYLKSWSEYLAHLQKSPPNGKKGASLLFLMINSLIDSARDFADFAGHLLASYSTADRRGTAALLGKIHLLESQSESFKEALLKKREYQGMSLKKIVNLGHSVVEIRASSHIFESSAGVISVISLLRKHNRNMAEVIAEKLSSANFRRNLEESALDISTGILERVLKDNPGLMRSPRVLVLLRITPPDSSPASFYPVAPFRILQIQLSFSESLFDYVIRSDANASRKARFESEIYKSILHELVHAADSMKESPGAANRLLNALRSEGIAKASETLLSCREKKCVVDFRNFVILAYDGKKKMTDLFNAARAGLYTASELLRIAYREGGIHHFGILMFWTIFAAKSKSFTTLWLCPRQLPGKEKLSQFIARNNTRILRNFGCRQINNHAFGRNLYTGELVMVVEDMKKAKEVLKIIELMTEYSFTEEFWKACKDVEIDPKPLTKSTFLEAFGHPL